MVIFGHYILIWNTITYYNPIGTYINIFWQIIRISKEIDTVFSFYLHKRDFCQLRQLQIQNRILLSAVKNYNSILYVSHVICTTEKTRYSNYIYMPQVFHNISTNPDHLIYTLPICCLSYQLHIQPMDPVVKQGIVHYNRTSNFL